VRFDSRTIKLLYCLLEKLLAPNLLKLVLLLPLSSFLGERERGVKFGKLKTMREERD